MNTLYSRNSDLEEDDEPRGRDREMTLGTSFIVGIFFALVLICAIFFAFGYSLGRRSALPASGVPPAVTGTNTSISKPSSGIAAPQAASTNSSTVENSLNEQEASPAEQTPVAQPAKLAIKPAAASRPAGPSAARPSAGQFVVQVAAVSRAGDAEMLVSALKRHGYNAAVRQLSPDKLLHVQIGPFATKKDADAMRQRLIADGYNAIVK